jgi:hypothetical protein
MSRRGQLGRGVTVNLDAVRARRRAREARRRAEASRSGVLRELHLEAARLQERVAALIAGECGRAVLER